MGGTLQQRGSASHVKMYARRWADGFLEWSSADAFQDLRQDCADWENVDSLSG